MVPARTNVRAGIHETTSPIYAMSSMKANTLFVLPALAALLVAGCSTPQPIQLNQKLTTFSRQDLEKMDPIALPPNYGAGNFKKIQMGVSFESPTGVEKVGGESKAMPVSPTLSSKLQNEMAKLKRFTVFSAHNRDGVMAFQALEDVDGDVSLARAVDVKDIDVVLSAKVLVTKEKQKRYNDTLVIYEVECAFSCEDLKTRTVKIAETVKGATSRTQFVSYTGRITSGFEDSGDNEAQAIEQAAMHALALLGNKLGNAYPAGGRITGSTATGEKLTLDKGFEEGIGANQQCIVYVDDGGVDVPIACAEAAPKADGTSQLSVYRWNKGDKDAKPLIKLFQQNPKGFIKDNAVYAVGYGMPIPPAWQTQDDSSEAARQARQ